MKLVCTLPCWRELRGRNNGRRKSSSGEEVVPPPPSFSSFGRERMGWEESWVRRQLSLTPACTPSLFWSSNGGMGGPRGRGQRTGLGWTPSTEALFSPPSFMGGGSYSIAPSSLPFGFARIWFALGLRGAFRLLASEVIIFRPRVLELWVLSLMVSLIRCCLVPGCSSSLYTWGSLRFCIQISHQFSMRMEPGSLLILLG